MFKINSIKKADTDYLKIESIDQKSHALIYLSNGGSLQELVLHKKKIIHQLTTADYTTSYASAILFPFANRIDKASYSFQEKKYTLKVNLKEENNAIHGLVYNKKFTLKDKEITQQQASVTLVYSEQNKAQGFPFIYTIELIYTLTEDALSLTICITNNDVVSFPFNVGWHPYFYSSNLYNSSLYIDSSSKFSFSTNEMIPIKTKDASIHKELQIKDRFFDDCYLLNTDKMVFKTPDYHIQINSSLEKNYVQIFTPSDRKSIAIEPITAPPNSFNHKLGLGILNPDENYTASWKVSLKSTSHEN
ncbi:MAG: aldose 1-epimerase [Polaribacter sp.]|nr:aldose 1-epimerase [Polaribacter sp.]